MPPRVTAPTVRAPRGPCPHRTPTRPPCRHVRPLTGTWGLTLWEGRPGPWVPPPSQAWPWGHPAFRPPEQQPWPTSSLHHRLLSPGLFSVTLPQPGPAQPHCGPWTRSLASPGASAETRRAQEAGRRWGLEKRPRSQTRACARARAAVNSHPVKGVCRLVWSRDGQGSQVTLLKDTPRSGSLCLKNGLPSVSHKHWPGAFLATGAPLARLTPPSLLPLAERAFLQKRGAPAPSSAAWSQQAPIYCDLSRFFSLPIPRVISKLALGHLC